MDVDSRAYFTAATCAISFIIILSVNTPPLFFPNKINQMVSHQDTQLTIWDKQLSVSSKLNGKLTKKERDSIHLTTRAKSILIGLLLSDG
jgi:hypothetical protein